MPRRGVGGAARRDATPRRRRRASALRAAEGARRAGGVEPRDGDRARAPRRQGPRPAQRPAERVVDRRQLPDRAHDAGSSARAAQKAEFLPGLITGTHRLGFGLTEPDHGSDATWLETTAVRDGDDWVINGAQALQLRACTTRRTTWSSRAPRASRATPRASPASSCRRPRPGFHVEFMWWTFNMPSDHAEVTLTDVRVPHASIFGAEGEGLALAQHFVHENRIRQAASGVGAAQYCIDESVAYAQQRIVFGKPLWLNQAIQFPLAELHTECEMVRTLVYKTAWLMDQQHHMDVSDKVSMCNYRANRLVCEAADTRHPGARRHRLHAAQAVRAHLPPPPPLPHHRGLRRDPDPPRRRYPVRPPGEAVSWPRQGRSGMHGPMTTWRSSLVAAVLAIATAASASAATVTVFAAASLSGAFTAATKAFAAAHPGTEVQCSFAGSSTLVQQIHEGARADVLASADEATMEKLVDGGATVAAPQVFARNRLAILVAKGNPKKIESLARPRPAGPGARPRGAGGAGGQVRARGVREGRRRRADRQPGARREGGRHPRRARRGRRRHRLHHRRARRRRQGGGRRDPRGRRTCVARYPDRGARSRASNPDGGGGVRRLRAVAGGAARCSPTLGFAAP